MPTLSAQAFAATEDQAFSGQVAATDPGDTLAFAVTTQPTRGTLTINAAGAFTYTPQSNFFGADTFVVRVTDSASQTATATMTLNVSGVDDAPVARDDVLEVTPPAHWQSSPTTPTWTPIR